MAVLTRFAAGGGGAGAVFAECFFQAEAVEQGHVMTGAAEYRIGDIGELLDLLVYLAARFLGVGDDPVLVGVVEHAG